MNTSNIQDSPGPINDEVIADSEDEMDEEDHPGNPGILSANMKDIANIVSQVSASTFPGQLHGKSSISAFTAGPSQLNQVSEAENFQGTASIADRAKTRQRNPKSSIQNSFSKPNVVALSADCLEKRNPNDHISSDIIELSSDEDDLNLRSSKPKPKPKAKLKVKDNPRDANNDKILDDSGTTETSTDKSSHAIPDSRPRPRPRPLVKRSKPVQESTDPPPPLPPYIPGLLSSPSASVYHGPDLPIATSPVRPDLLTSQLPPSDPPLPTLSTIHDENDLPPIETLPNHDFDGPLSSPSSLFSDFGSTTKKRKRTAFNLEIDELASDVDLGPGQTAAGALNHHDDGVAPQVPPHLLPPPPTFFPESSSSSIGDNRRLSPQVPSKLTRDVVDLTMLPPTIQPIGATATIKVSKKAKISRQKKDDATRMDEDELDNDFDPTESTTEKGNSKSKPKPKAKKGGDSKAKKGKGRAQIEDSIVSKPKTQIIKEKGKGKVKATAGDKDTFKSREFIYDSGDDQDPILLAPISPGNPGKSMSSSSSNRINKKRKSVIESDLEDHEDEGEKGQQAIETSLKKGKGKQGKKNSGNVDGIVKQNNTISISTPSKTAKTTSEDHAAPVDLSLPSSNRMNKKRSTIESSLEDEDEREKDQRAGTSSKKKFKQAKNGGNVEDQQPAPEAEVVKENAIKLTAKVSKKDESTDSALFPSLHSRYEIAPRRSSLPMSELIRRSNSALGSPFSTPQPRTSTSSAARPIKSGTTTYSPYLKSSRSVLSRIAPLHPNRRSPPAPLPPPPPRKKTKKELEMEEKWEEEMIDSVGGISEWTCLTDDEKKGLKRAKWAREMGDWDD